MVGLLGWGINSSQNLHTFPVPSLNMLLHICIPKVLTRISVRALAIMIKVDRGFPQVLQVNADILPVLGHDRYLPNPSQFISSSLIVPRWCCMASMCNPRRSVTLGTRSPGAVLVRTCVMKLSSSAVFQNAKRLRNKFWRIFHFKLFKINMDILFNPEWTQAREPN